MKRRWQVKPSDPLLVDRICRESGCHRVIAAIMANRGIASGAALEAFLNPSWSRVRSIDRLIDMDKAVGRIADALFRKEKILIFGDYDVDGITATTILLEFLLHAGADATYYIPDRMTEGYGLAAGHIDDVARVRGATLLITVDCGSDSHDAVKRAGQYGIDVIVTDHHRVSTSMPEACALVNPCRNDCPSKATCLAGAGVAFFLIIRLRAYLRDKGFWHEGRPQPNLKDYCDLAALGSISDVVPMVSDTRLITRVGLEVLNTRPRPGIQALLNISGNKKQTIDEEDIGFRIGPRLNATGRMERADLGVEILRTRDPAEAVTLAERINLLNQDRQAIEKSIHHRIRMYFEESPELLTRKTIVLCQTNWHEGVLGIVASRLVERFYRPVVLISFRDGLGKGSARSVPGVDMHAAIAACAAYLDGYGGHPMAAGIRLRPENYDPFKKAFEDIITKMTAGLDLTPTFDIDCALDIDLISDSLMDELAALQPFGPDHLEPVFLARNVSVGFAKEVGAGHIRFALTNARRKNAPPVTAIWFNADLDAARQRFFPQMVYRLRHNHWKGKTSVQIMIDDVVLQP
ncbi:MAG: single-stranded-DNA-specific exonuclease RecJ [Desulfobacteraceae bacterium]|nr:MAG: single-stranded-DNA-specific exonuclease RecJ [Desulfobacteraceae bacterium]